VKRPPLPLKVGVMSPAPMGARPMPVSYGLEILTGDYFVLSQYRHLADRQAELRQQYCALHYMHGKCTDT